MNPKIFDCIIFNDEVDLLVERLKKNYSWVDFILIVESPITFSGKQKKLNFLENQEKYEEWADKIKYFVCPVNNNYILWEYELYQRNYIIKCLEASSVEDNDIIFVSDVDEFIEIPKLLEYKSQIPFRFVTSFYYYFTDIKTNEKWEKNICVHWRDIKNISIGNRENYKNIFTKCIERDNDSFGKHLSFMYGYDVKKYQKKISSFSHSEYNNFYFKNRIRLRYFINLKKDIFERHDLVFVVTKPYGFMSDGLKDANQYKSDRFHLVFSVFSMTYIQILRIVYQWHIRFMNFKFRSVNALKRKKLFFRL